MSTKTQSTTEAEKEVVKTAVPYSDKEFAYRGYLARRLDLALRQKQATYAEINDQTPDEWYDSNAKAGNGYNPPKQNEEDTRIVTGTTQEKGSTLLSAVLNYNLEPNIQAFDKNNLEYIELGENMEDLVRKSREIEKYDRKRPLIYKELFDQGTVYVEEVDVQKFHTEKKMKNKDWKVGGIDPERISWTKKLKKLYSECEVNLLAGNQVYLGNFREFFMENQPYVFTREVIPYSLAKSLYQDWARFDYVPRTASSFQSLEVDEYGYRDWSVQTVEAEMVEVIKYQDSPLNEFQIILNGVMMLPIEFPLTEISPSGEYTMAKGDVEPISRWFAISKSIPAKTKVDQGILDETYRLILLTMRKSFMPPMANNTNKVLSRKVLFPGKITRDIDVTKFLPIGEKNDGVTPSQFAFFQLLKQIIDEKSVSPVFSGDVQKGNATATQIIEMKKQQMMKLGLTIWGVISLEEQLAKLRLHNLLSVWTRKIDERMDPIRQQLTDIYRTVSVKSNFEDGRKGTKIIEFNPELANSLSSEQVEAEEEFLSRKGNPTRKVYLDPEALRNIDMNWYITITPTEKETSELQRVLFVQNIKDAAELFGPQTLNVEHLKHRFSILAGEDPEKFWLRSQPQQNGPAVAGGIVPPGQLPGGGPGGAIPAQIAKGAGVPMNPAAQKPGLSKLLANA